MSFKVNSSGNLDSVYGNNLSKASTSDQKLNTVWGNNLKSQKQDDNGVKVVFKDDGSYEKIMDYDGDGKPDISIIFNKDNVQTGLINYSYGEREYYNQSGESRLVPYAILDCQHFENGKTTLEEQFIQFDDGRKIKTAELIPSDELGGDFVYQIHYDSETGLPTNSLERYTAKDNVPEQWIGFEKEEILYGEDGKPKTKIVHTYTTDEEGYLVDNRTNTDLTES